MNKKVIINDKFIGRYVRLIKDIVIPYQEKALKDEIEGAEKSHCIENFRLAAKKLKTGSCNEEFYGMVFQDSDVAKWLEAAAYSLADYPDSELEARCDEIIDIIGDAQHEDGYLNTYFTVKSPELRWTNLQEAHELYCAGHMIEAAVAYASCTGKTKLLDIMCKMADHIYNRFITEKAEGYSGHPEIELALMRLFDYTKNEKYLQLANHFIDCRGEDSDFYVKEKAKRNWTVWNADPYNKDYTQSAVPVREQSEATGHAVRAVYLYTGMAMAAAVNKDTSLASACRRLWRNICDEKLYVTGAIGSVYEGEAFSKNKHLPNDTAYAETCAAIGLIFFARAMLSIEKNSEYADVMEKALYNCVLAGMELDGTKFFYVNPLEVIPGISACSPSHPHTLPQRPKWFTCACCPPNVARLIASIGDYAYITEDDNVYCNLYIGGEITLNSGKITVQTDFPNGEAVKYRFTPNDDKMKATLAIRIADWSRNTRITLNGKEAIHDVQNGYCYISNEFKAGDIIELSLDMSVRKIYANPNVSHDIGKVAFTRGALVYCAEGVDNDGEVLPLVVKANGKIKTSYESILGEIVQITAQGYRLVASNSLYSFEKPQRQECEIKLIPYYAWANRGLTQMRIWLPEQE